MFRRSHILLVSVFVALGTIACGDDSGPTETGPMEASVSGTITDHPGGQGIAGATVTGSAAGTEVFSVTTDATGTYQATFEIADPPGQLTISAMADKFESRDSTTPFSENMTLNLELRWGSPFSQDCVSLDPDNVTIEAIGDDFRVIDGPSALMVFPELQEAQDARDLIQFYGFTDACFVGRPDPEMTYWLVDGGPVPFSSESPVDEDCVGVNPDNVTVEELGDEWRVVDGPSALMVFPELQEAEDARDLIQFYEFTNVCFVGRPDPGMSYWLR